MASAFEKLSKAYDEEWIAGTGNSANCSGFMKAVALQFGFNLPDQKANGIIAYLEAQANLHPSEWIRIKWELPKGEPEDKTGKRASLATIQMAIKASVEGKLVIVAATGDDYAGGGNGHVAILLPKLAGPHSAPLVFGGAENAAARSAGTKTIREVWSPSKHTALRFYQHRSVLMGPL